METTAYTGPWDLERLKQPPAATWGEPVRHPGYAVSPLYYANEPYEGKPTKVFAYYAVPDSASERPVPAIVLVHGGGGKAFSEWAETWAGRGYAAIAMDLTGRGPDESPMAEGGPDMTENAMFRDISEHALTEMWSYHAVGAVIRAVSFLAAQPNIDPAAIGMMGISWGGYLTEIVTGLETRLAYAMPVYAAGYYEESSCWQDILRGMDEEKRQLWNANFDVKMYIGQSVLPMFWATGTNDTAFYLDSWQKTYRQAEGERTLRLIQNWTHDYNTPWSTPEFFSYADAFVKGGAPLLRVTATGESDAEAWAIYAGTRAVKGGDLLYTVDTGDYVSRSWHVVSADLDEAGRKVSSNVPNDATAYCFTIEDESGQFISSDLIIRR